MLPKHVPKHVYVISKSILLSPQWVFLMLVAGGALPQPWILAGCGQSGQAGRIDVSTDLYLKAYRQQHGERLLHALLRHPERNLETLSHRDSCIGAFNLQLPSSF